MRALLSVFPSACPADARNALIGLLLSVASVGGSVDAVAAPLPGSFTGGGIALDANVQAGPVAVTLGRAAVAGTSCNGTNGVTRVGQTLRIAAELGGLKIVEVGASRSTALTTRAEDTAKVTTTSGVTDLSLLDGLVTASVVRGRATVTATRAALVAATSGSIVEDLVVAGEPIDLVSVAPNTRLALPGVGTLTLRQVTNVAIPGSRRTEVQMMVLRVNVANRFGLPLGTEIVIGRAFAGYYRTPATTSVTGVAYGTEANAAIGSTLQNQIGRAAVVGMTCRGTDGETIVRRLSALNVGNVLDVGPVRSTARGGSIGNGAVAHTTANVEAVSMLGGLVQAARLSAVAWDRRTATGRISSAEGTGVFGLRIGGIGLGNVTSFNRGLTVPGVGGMVVNEVIPPLTASGPNSRLRVNALRLTVGLPTSPLPIGAEIIVGHAEASAAF